MNKAKLIDAIEKYDKLQSVQAGVVVRLDRTLGTFAITDHTGEHTTTCFLEDFSEEDQKRIDKGTECYQICGYMNYEKDTCYRVFMLILED